MVNYCINVIDSKGNKFQNAKIDVKSYYGFEEVDVIIDSLEIFSREELVLFMNLIEKRVDYGGDVIEIYEYIKLYKKIEKIVCRNDYK